MLIKNGTVYTAVQPEPLQADIAVENGVIRAIAPGLSPAPGEEVVDAAGLRVPRLCGRAQPSCAGRLRHGVRLHRLQ